ncbi:DUF2029 domain-containing protein [Ktedonosporobacter rubrisoli]|uniref:DUF2029 domain-containing protein n=1 Tax=Ktedonosporobacter rubrisoli TaxID=2509675 RepID=A0A4P6JIS3_KTERU|nr:glycosyltransferase family 87 protein [Ktedonosporobacter rubrisoli]QBD74968.1 DUF2029 domain-containing protein [Ktedonosporobacter rubrisoli]
MKLLSLRTNWHPSDKQINYWRLAALGGLLGISLCLYAVFLLPNIAPIAPTLCWMFALLPYGLACFIVLKKKALQGRMLWLELGLILAGACLLRGILLPTEPRFSPDAWRYIWDARVTLHGFSPYVYAPQDPQLLPLRNMIYEHIGYRTVPTIYPPAAQLWYLVSYLLAPDNIVALKTVFAMLDIISCGLLAYFLYLKGRNPALTIVYAWCPLPIVEFAGQGHLDVIAISFSLMALLCTRYKRRWLVGILIGVATLAKFYPALLLIAVLKRHDWKLLLGFAGTLVLGYAPYVWLGHGQIFGFLLSYSDEYAYNSGPIQHLIFWLADQIRVQASLLTSPLEGLWMLGAALLTIWLRLKKNMQPEGAFFLLITALFMISPHIYPWYTAIFVAGVVLLLNSPELLVSSRYRLLPVLLLYFACVTPLYYLVNGKWLLYYALVYGVPISGACLVLLLSRRRFRPIHNINENVSDISCKDQYEKNSALNDRKTVETRT